MGQIEYFEEVIRNSKADPAKKNVARNIVEMSGKLVTGVGDIKDVFNHLLLITTLLLEMYLAEDERTQIANAIEAHMRQCKEKGPLNLKRTFLAVATKATWPSAILTIAILYREEISLILRALVKA